MEDIIPDITSMPQAIVVQRGQTAKFHCEATVSNSKYINIARTLVIIIYQLVAYNMKK